MLYWRIRTDTSGIYFPAYDYPVIFLGNLYIEWVFGVVRSFVEDEVRDSEEEVSGGLFVCPVIVGVGL